MESSIAMRKVLVVEDYPDSADSLAVLLRLHGFDPAIARDGLQALELADQLQPDVVLLDIGLPKVNGYDVCRHIRSTAWGRNIAVIAVTGFGQTRDRLQAAEAGIDAHLLKPANADDLLRAVQRAIASGRTGAARNN